jgi:hypothetical protein
VKLYNLNSSGNLKLGQWGKLFIMFKSNPFYSLENFGRLEVPFSYCKTWNPFDIWLVLGLLKRVYWADLYVQCSPAPNQTHEAHYHACPRSRTATAVLCPTPTVQAATPNVRRRQPPPPQFTPPTVHAATPHARQRPPPQPWFLPPTAWCRLRSPTKP